MIDDVVQPTDGYPRYIGFVHAGASVAERQRCCSTCAHQGMTYQEWNNSDEHVVAAAYVCDWCGAEERP